MGILRSTILFSIICVVVCVGGVFAECPLYQTAHTVNGNTVCCKPVFLCGKDHQVVFCSVDGEADTCVACSPGALNFYMTSSLDTVRHVCFNKTKSHDDCPMQDTYPTSENESCEHMFCRCQTDVCRYGNPCEICYMRQTPCGINEELNSKTGDCEACKNLMNSTAGCGPCLYNETAWRLAQELKSSSSEKVTTEVMVPNKDPSASGNAIMTHGSGYIIVTDKPSNGSNDTLYSEDGEQLSITPVIILILILVVIGAFVAIYLFVLKKIKTGDTNSRLVVIYNKLLPNNKYRQQDDKPDPENAQHNGDVARDDDADGKQTQAVSPILRQPDGTDGEPGTNDGAIMGLLKSEDGACGTTDETDIKQT